MAHPRAKFLFFQKGHVCVECPHCNQHVLLTEELELWNCHRCHNYFEFSVSQEDLKKAKTNREHRRNFIASTVELMAAIFIENGRVGTQELNYCAEFLRGYELGPMDYDLIDDLWKAAFRKRPDPLQAATMFRNCMGDQPEAFMSFTTFLLEVSFKCFGHISTDRFHDLKAIAVDGLGLETGIFEKKYDKLYKKYLSMHPLTEERKHLIELLLRPFIELHHTCPEAHALEGLETMLLHMQLHLSEWNYVHNNTQELIKRSKHHSNWLDGLKAYNDQDRGLGSALIESLGMGLHQITRREAVFMELIADTLEIADEEYQRALQTSMWKKLA